MTTELDTYLAHYGVKGMRWGFRRRSDGSVETTGKRTKSSDDHETSRSLLKEKTKTLSNAELRTINERLQLEKTYSELTSSQSGMAKVRNGNKKAKDILAVASTANQVYTLATSPMGKAIKTALSK